MVASHPIYPLDQSLVVVEDLERQLMLINGSYNFKDKRKEIIMVDLGA